VRVIEGCGVSGKLAAVDGWEMKGLLKPGWRDDRELLKERERERGLISLYPWRLVSGALFWTCVCV